MAFDVGEGTEWTIWSSAAQGKISGHIIFNPVDSVDQVSVIVAPSRVGSAEEALTKCRQDAVNTGLEVEDLGEVEINGIAYYKFARIFEYNPPGLNLCTF